MRRPNLHPTRPADLEFVLATERDPEIAPYVGASSRARHIRQIDDPSCEHLLVRERGERVGYGVLAGLGEDHRSVQIAALVIAERGRGLGTAAMRLLLDRAFDRHEAHRVWVAFLRDNEPARRTYAAVGFTPEGVSREAWVADDGHYETLIVLSMLDREWARRRKRRTFFSVR